MRDFETDGLSTEYDTKKSNQIIASCEGEKSEKKSN